MPIVLLKSDARARQKPCLRCGYSLRNNIDARNCPECGLAVRLSLNNDDSLEMSNPLWVAKMSRATGLLVIAHLGFAAALAWAQFCYFLRWRSRLYTPLDRIRSTEIIVDAALAVAALGILVLAMPERRYPDRLLARRVMARIGVGVLVAVVAFEYLRPPQMIRFHFPITFQAATVVCAALCAWSILFELARRLPSRPLMQATRALGWSLGCGFVVMCNAGPGTYVLYMICWQPWTHYAWMWTVALTIYVVAATIVLTRSWHLFRAAARQAASNWVTDPS